MNARRVVRVAGLALVAGLLSVVAGVESLYVWWLPGERPQPADRPLPDRVRRAIWIEFGGTGEPELTPHRPFLISQVALATADGPSAQGRLLHALVLQNLARPMRRLEFLTCAMALSTWISRNWTAEQALDAYGSRVWMGDRAGQGLEAGAQYLWGRGLDSLEPHEIATLLALTQSPRLYDPVCRPARALPARDRVLERMEAARIIDRTTLERAIQAPLEVRPGCTRPSTLPGAS